MTTQGSPRLCGVCNNFLLEFLSFERAFARDFAKSHVDCLAENHDDCQKCYLDEYAPYASASEKIIYHPSIMSLKAAVDTDCYICTRMWKKLDRLACLPPKFPKLFKRIDGWRLRRIWFEEPLNKFEILLSNTFPDTPLVQIVHQRTSLSSSLAQANQWISRCGREHQCCKKRTYSASLPRRLIEVRKNPSSRLLKVRLCQSTVLPVDTAYCTLSHRWGQQNFVKLTSNNLAQFQQAIDICTLPRTFQDAINSTHALGFHYLWIDSLCIIQDSQDDWRDESYRMGDIYSNSNLNLAASAHNASSHGFFLDQRASDPLLPKLSLVLWPSTKESPTTNSKNQELVVQVADPWTELLDSPLFKRAWVLQEQLLAPRVLYFNDDQMFWACNELHASEVWPGGWPSWNDRDFVLENQSLDLATNHRLDRIIQFSVEAAIAENGNPYVVWRQIVGHYSRRLLTFPSDRLPALAGIASHFQKLFPGDQYLFGLWTGDMPYGLLWTSDLTEPEAVQEAPDWNKIPSWTWVSIGRNVGWTNDSLTDQDLSLSFSPVAQISPPETAFVQFALRIKGKIMKLGHSKAVVYQDRCHEPMPPIQHDSVFPVRSFHMTDHGNPRFKFYISMDSWYHYHVAAKSAGDMLMHLRELASSWYYLPIKRELWDLPSSYSRRGFGTQGLLLIKAHGHENGFYHRIGQAGLYGFNNDWFSSEELAAAIRTYQQDLQPGDYVESDGEGEYVIALV